MSTLLYPRLTRELARPRLQGIQDQDPEVLLAAPDLLLDGHTFAPIGGRQVTEDEISALREDAIEIARECGFPAKRDEMGRIRFDRQIGRFLHEQMAITPHQAADEEIWTHLSVGPLVALAAWRFREPPDDRLLGRAPRNTFRRLWWRSEVLGSLAWEEDGLLEDETVQIMERTGLSASPIVARALAEAFHRRQGAEDGGGRMELMRDALKRVNRLTPFLRMEALSISALEELFDELFADAASAITGGTTVRRPDPSDRADPVGVSRYLANSVDMAAAASLDPSLDGGTREDLNAPSGSGGETGYDGAAAPDDLTGDMRSEGSPSEEGEVTFETVPLGWIMRRLCEVVTEAGSIDDRDLPNALGEACDLSISKKRERLVDKLAWSARGRGYLEFDEDRGIWNPGERRPEFDDRFGDWTFAAIVDRAAEMLAADPEPFDALLIEVAARERAPRVLASIVGTALNEAKGSRRAVRR